MALKRRRSRCDVIDPGDLLRAWEPFAIRGLDFSFKEYEKDRRGQGPHWQGLNHYFDLLLETLQVAPQGLPAWAVVNHVITELSKSYKMSEGQTLPCTDSFARKSADKVRLMCRALHDLAIQRSRRPGFTIPDVKVRLLVDAIKLSGMQDSCWKRKPYSLIRECCTLDAQSLMQQAVEHMAPTNNCNTSK